jgi:hypothetical protein
MEICRAVTSGSFGSIFIHRYLHLHILATRTLAVLQDGSRYDSRAS